MTDFYAPNQQVVRADGSGPAEEGDGGSTAPETTPATFDPGAHTISQVQDYVTANPAERSAVLEAESAGKNRTTLIEWFATG